MKVTFLKSDAMSERFGSEPDEYTVDFPLNVQLTYDELRTCRQGEIGGFPFREGDVIAFYNPAYDAWVTNTNNQHWSDVVIGAEDE